MARIVASSTGFRAIVSCGMFGSLGARLGARASLLCPKEGSTASAGLRSTDPISQFAAVLIRPRSDILLGHVARLDLAQARLAGSGPRPEQCSLDRRRSRAGVR